MITSLVLINHNPQLHPQVSCEQHGMSIGNMLMNLWLMINQLNLWNKNCRKISSNMAYELENRMIYQRMWGASIIFWQPDFCRKEHWTSPWSSSEVPEIGSTWKFGSTWTFGRNLKFEVWNDDLTPELLEVPEISLLNTETFDGTPLLWLERLMILRLIWCEKTSCWQHVGFHKWGIPKIVG